MKCIYCQHPCNKKGKCGEVQKYQCKNCLRYFQNRYAYKKYLEQDEKNIASLNNEGMGISSIARYLRIPKTTVMRKLESYASKLKKPEIVETFQSYDLDEIKTFIRTRENECWLAYGINHKTGAVIDYVVGKRNTKTISVLINKINHLNPKRVFTDGLNIYSSLIKGNVHAVGKYLTWRIERNHLTIRDRLKRLSRETLCFSKSERMLNCCVKILLWG